MGQVFTVPSIELDYALEPETREKVLQEISDAGLKYTVLAEDGPAGGNPLIKIEGTRSKIEAYLKDVYLEDDSDDPKQLDFYTAQIKE